MKRRRRTAAARLSIKEKHGHICCLCLLPITQHKRWILEHIKPLWLGGADDETNLAPAHFECAIEKTRDEAAIKAKSDRIIAKHNGAKRARKPFPGNRQSGWKKKMNGDVVRRT